MSTAGANPRGTSWNLSPVSAATARRTAEERTHAARHSGFANTMSTDVTKLVLLQGKPSQRALDQVLPHHTGRLGASLQIGTGELDRDLLAPDQ